MAYRCGDVARATELAWLASNPYHQRIAKSLSESIDDGEHVLLPVEFVRQHHMTCAPATVAAISRYWSRPVEHLSLAEEICYDGTSAHSQRKWAEENGWHVREFTVEWPSAKALLDEGIPFCLSTVEPTSAHMQAVIGYDTRRNVLLVRDPYQRAMSEFLIREMLSRYGFCGPRGLAFVPPEKADVLKSLELADAPLYDQMYQLQTALLENERDQAQEILDAMRQTDPDHRLTWEARLSVSSFDSDLPSTLDGIEKLLGHVSAHAAAGTAKALVPARVGPRVRRVASA